MTIVLYLPLLLLLSLTVWRTVACSAYITSLRLLRLHRCCCLLRKEPIHLCPCDSFFCCSRLLAAATATPLSPLVVLLPLPPGEEPPPCSIYIATSPRRCRLVSFLCCFNTPLKPSGKVNKYPPEPAIDSSCIPRRSSFPFPTLSTPPLATNRDSASC